VAAPALTEAPAYRLKSCWGWAGKKLHL